MNSEHNKRDSDSSADITPLLYLIMVGLIIYAVIYLILILGVILTIGLTAGAAYFGYKTALDTQLWEGRRIEKDKHLEAQRTKELEYFQSQDKEWMAQVVNNFYDDKERDLYQVNKNVFEEITRKARQVKDLFQ